MPNPNITSLPSFNEAVAAMRQRYDRDGFPSTFDPAAHVILRHLEAITQPSNTKAADAQPYDPWDTGLTDAVAYLRSTLAKAQVNTRSTSALRSVLAELDRLTAVVAPPSEEDKQDVRQALQCLTHDRAGSWRTVAGVLGAEVERLSAELRGREGAEIAQPDSAPEVRDITPSNRRPGLRYFDPAARFNCFPADQAFSEHAKTGGTFSVLELRVMAAHLSTALDNVRKALLARGAGA